MPVNSSDTPRLVTCLHSYAYALEDIDRDLEALREIADFEVLRRVVVRGSGEAYSLLAVAAPKSASTIVRRLHTQRSPAEIAAVMCGDVLDDHYRHAVSSHQIRSDPGLTGTIPGLFDKYEPPMTLAEVSAGRRRPRPPGSPVPFRVAAFKARPVAVEPSRRGLLGRLLRSE